MATRANACNSMRNFTLALGSRRADYFGHVITRGLRQPRLRPSSPQQTFATPTSRPFTSSSRPVILSKGTGKDNYKTQLHDGSKKATLSTMRCHRPAKASLHTSAPTHNGSAAVTSQSDESLSEVNSSLPPSPKPKQEFIKKASMKMQAMCAWLDVKTELGHIQFASASTVSRTVPGSWFDYELYNPATEKLWKYSAWSKHTTLSAKKRAIAPLIPQLQQISDWNNHLTASHTPLRARARFLEMMITDRLILRFSLLEQKAVLRVPGTEKVFSVSLDQQLNWKSLEKNPELLVNTISVLIEEMQKDGIWEDLVKVPFQQSNQNSTLQPFLEKTPPGARDGNMNMSQKSINKLFEEYVVQHGDVELYESIKSLVQLNTKTHFDAQGLRVCRAIYNEGLYDMREASITVDPAEPISGAQLQTRAMKLLISKLECTNLLSQLRSLKQNTFELSLDDDFVWGLQERRDRLSRAMRTASFLPITRSQEKKSLASGPDRREVRRSGELARSLDKRLTSQHPKTCAILSDRAQLPVSRKREEILRMIEQHPYSILSAETGSGKSTQIPQMILEEAIRGGSGGECNVLCIQPRRIAAQMLGKRVADEREEPIGETVGYATRFDKIWPDRNGSITYCTTGLALKMFQNDGDSLRRYTHIILDEVHVRDVNIDFMMLLLKRHVDQCQSLSTPAPRVVIMSATLDLDLFTSYFHSVGPDGTSIPAPSITIPGRQHQVNEHFLDDILDDLATTLEPKFLTTLLGAKDTLPFLERHYAKFGEHDTSKELELTKDPATPASAALEEDPFMPYGIISALIVHILSTTESGSILIFLPGLQAIDKLHDEIPCLASRPECGIDFSNASKLRVLKLHAGLPKEMAKLSESFPGGCRRILLSTDVAEASVTLPDVKFVIDTGRVKQIFHNSATHSRQLVTSWISRSNATQRAGRAGRVQNGEYYFLGTKKCYDSLRISRSPAIQREDLHSICLQAKDIAPDVPVLEMLQQAIEPPDTVKVLGTLESLKVLKALDEDERITDLGVILGGLGLTPHAAKLVILGVLFRCLNPMIILAVRMDGESLFRWPKESQDVAEIRKRRERFAQGSHSDHIAEVNAFNALRQKVEEGLAEEFALSNHLELPVFFQNMQNSRLIMRWLSNARYIAGTSRFENKQFGHDVLNTHSHDVSLIKALVTHTLSSRFAIRTRKATCSTKTEKLAIIESTSAAARLRSGLIQESLTYTGKVQIGDLINILNVSPTSPIVPCLLGDKLIQNGEVLRFGSWLPVLVKPESAFTEDETAQTLIDYHQSIALAFAATFRVMRERMWRRVEGERSDHMPLGTSLIRNLRGAVLHVVSLQEAWEAERTLKLMSVKWKTKGPDLDQDQDEDEDQALAQALEQGQGQDLAPDLKEASD